MRSLLLTLAASALLGSAVEAEIIVPTHERQPALPVITGAPAKNQGIRSVRLLGAVDLGHDFAAMGGYQLRAREIIVEPGGEVGVHRHEQRPGVAVVVEGRMTEMRGLEGLPVTYGPGGTSFETTGVIHWWRNQGEDPARAVVVDIVPITTP
ncbi:MAG: cupin domain-containing protein [Prochlorococcus sp.]|nr:cupin domain-containing protein [Prochlorococcaceae cyanobacterium Fu_MAG_50]